LPDGRQTAIIRMYGMIDHAYTRVKGRREGQA
jgi:hypothetical protein